MTHDLAEVLANALVGLAVSWGATWAVLGFAAAVRCQLVRQLGINIQNPVDLLSGRGDVALQPQQIPTDQSATPFLRDRGRIWSASQMRAAA